MKEPVIRLHHLYRFISGFPQATVVRLETCGHYRQEEEAERMTETLSQFLTFTA